MNKEITKIESGLIEIKPEEVPDRLKKNGLDEYIEAIKSKVAGFEGDASTAKGRKEIIAMAAKVTTSKTTLSGLAETFKKAKKSEIADVQGVISAVIAEEKRMSAELSRVAKQVRQPVTDFEEAKKARVALLKQRVDDIRSYEKCLIFKTSNELGAAIRNLEKIKIDDSFQELKPEAEREHASILSRLKSALKLAEDKEALEAEKAEIKAAEDARKQKERDERLQREAAETAKKEAEEERINALAKRVDDIRTWKWKEGREWKNASAIQSRIDDINAFVIDDSYGEFKGRAQEAKDKLLKKHKEGLKIAEAWDAEELRKSELGVAEKAKREIEEARLKKEEEEREAAKKERARTENKEHRAKVCAEIKKSLVECLAIPGLVEEEKTLHIQATKLLTALELDRIKHFKIEY
jgi:hypothetical protein